MCLRGECERERERDFELAELEPLRLCGEPSFGLALSASSVDAAGAGTFASGDAGTAGAGTGAGS